MQTDSNKPRVFVVHINGQDFSKAEAFGALVPILEGPVSPFMPDRLRALCEEKLDTFTSNDYLLLSGNALGCAFAWEAAVDVVNAKLDAYVWPSEEAASAYVRTAPRAVVRLLLFDAKKREYFVRSLDV